MVRTIGTIVIGVVLVTLTVGGGLLALYRPNALAHILPFMQTSTQNHENNTTIVQTQNTGFPTMVLTTLQGNEDHSPAKQSYDSSNHVLLPVDEHIRFDTPEYRIPESLKVVAVSSATGTIHTLLKSYDVNNEFFVKLEPGDYQFRVQATWSELGTNVYVFDVTVSE